MHLEKGTSGVNTVKSKLITDLEGGADYQIGKMVFRGADNEIIASGDRSDTDELADHVAERDPEGAPGVISVDRGIRVIVKPIGENARGRKPEIFPGPLQIIERAVQSVVEL
jgi:hypothetical protein